MSLITYEADGQVATLIINRPEALNALNADLLAALGAALDRAEASECRCLVLTGAGRAFVAGADLPAMAELTPAEAREFSEQGNALFLRLQRSPVPSIAAVNGYALGGGLELALACDLRIASVKAKFALPEVSLGVIPGFGGTQRLARLVGPGFAAEMLLTGSQVDAAKAATIGLVNEVVTAEDLAERAAELAKLIASRSPVAIQAAKRALWFGMQTNLQSGLEIETTEFATCFGTWDQREGMGAFVAKRQPEPFQGR